MKFNSKLTWTVDLSDYANGVDYWCEPEFLELMNFYALVGVNYVRSED